MVGKVRSAVATAFIPASAAPSAPRPARQVCARPRHGVVRLAQPRRLQARAPTRMAQATRPSIGPELPVPAGSVRLNVLGQSGVFNARLVMLAVPLLWGSFLPVARLLYQLPWGLSPALFNALRLAVSFACVCPAVMSELRAHRPDRKALLMAGAELGLWCFLANGLQIIGLQYTTASRAAFLSQLQAVLVPVFACLAGMAAGLSWHVWAASSLALAGVGMLTLDNAAAAFTLQGDGLMVLVAIIGAVFVLRTRTIATKLRSTPLVGFKVAFQMVYAFMFMAAQAVFCGPGGAARFPGGLSTIFAGSTPMLVALNVGLVLWAGAFVSALATWLHVRANTVVPAAETAVIFTFTPLWASAFAVYIGERFGTKGIIGGALIAGGALLSSLAPKGKKKVATIQNSQGLPSAIENPQVLPSS